MTQNRVISVICCTLRVLSLCWCNLQTVSHQASGRPTVSSCSLGTQVEVEFRGFRYRRAQISALLCCSPSSGILTGGNLLSSCYSFQFFFHHFAAVFCFACLILAMRCFRRFRRQSEQLMLAPELQHFRSDLSFVSLLHPPVT